MEFGRAFTYAFQDPDWLKKVGIAAVVFLIPIIGPIVLLGWGLEITRRVINDDPDPLPGWDNFSAFISTGFQAFVVTLAYSLPLILLAICNQFVQVATFGVVAASNSSDTTSLSMIITVVSLCMVCLISIFGIAAGVITPVAMGRLAVSGEVGAAFRFREIFGLLRAAPGPYLLEILVVGLAYTILAPIGMLVCGIGLLAVMAYMTTLSAHLTGQAYKVANAAAPAL
jgi:hypothetical protein